MPVKGMAWTLSVCLLMTVLGNAQGRQPVPTRPDTAPTTDEGDLTRERMEQDQARKANALRQTSLKSDTDKLLKLATELKEYVDKSNENVLSLDVIKKADQIEKLAHSVKEKMRGPN